MYRRTLLTACLVSSLLLTAATSIGAAAAEPLPVYVTVPPQAYLVEWIGNRHVAVETLVRPGRDPHTFEPTPRQVVGLAKAKLYFKVGIPFERRLLEKIEGQHGRLVVVDTAEGIERRTADSQCCEDHEHHVHHATETDPHVWLSPPLLKIQVRNIARALEQYDPAHAEDYRRNLAEMLLEIDEIDREIAAVLEPYRGQSFYVYHAAFGYFGDAYGLKQEAVQVGGRSPTLRQLRALIHRAKAEGVKIVFLQPQFDQRSARKVAAVLDGTVVTIDPLAKDVLANLEHIAVEIRRALE